MSESPLVSVVTSVFNGGRFLERSLQSVLQQEGVEFEVVAIDDGSTDDSPAILDALAARDSRLRVIHQENAGLTRALIRGCGEARGRFIARHDSDDLSRPRRLARQADVLLADPRLSFVSCGVEAIGPEDEPLYEDTGPEDPEHATDLLLNRWHGPVHGSVMFRRDRYAQAGGYRPAFYFAQDSDLWLRLGEVGFLSYVPQSLYALRITPYRLSGRYAPTQRSLGLIVHQCQAARRGGRAEDELLKAAALLRPNAVARGSARPRDGTRELYFIGRCLVRRGDRRSVRYFREVLQKRPWSLRALAGLVQAHLLRHPAKTADVA